MVDLVNEKKQINFGKDSIFVRNYIDGILGGRNLDVTGFPLDTIAAGHVIITDGNGVYKPMPLSASTSNGVTTYSYGSLPEGYSYAGLLYRSLLTKRPMAAIITNGQVNSEVLPYDMSSILAAFKAACPLIVFAKDEESK